MAAKQTSLVGRVFRVVIQTVFLVLAGAVVYGVVRAAISPVSPANTVVLGGFLGLISLLWSKYYEFEKQREAAIAEKKRTVYRSLMTPWEKILAELKGKKTFEEVATPELLASAYGGTFDTVLYGSETVLRKYADFRAPEKKGRDHIDQFRSLGALLVAMREDVTGQKSNVPEDVVLRTFVNLTPEQVAEIRRREYVSRNPEAQRRVADLSSGKTPATPDGSKRDYPPRDTQEP